MNTEIEAKFVNIDHEEMRELLTKIGASLEQPMRLMRRALIDSPEMKANDAFVRVRDEGDKVTVTYKQFDELSVTGAKEIEVVVNSFDDTIKLFAAAGLPYRSFQESKRETWKLGTTEIVLDVWPWLNPYIEIEGSTQEDVQSVADKLGLQWSDAVFGDVMAAYRIQYPHLKLNDTVGNIPKVRFDDAIPELLRNS